MAGQVPAESARPAGDILTPLIHEDATSPLQQVGAYAASARLPIACARHASANVARHGVLPAPVPIRTTEPVHCAGEVKRAQEHPPHPRSRGSARMWRGEDRGRRGEAAWRLSCAGSRRGVAGAAVKCLLFEQGGPRRRERQAGPDAAAPLWRLAGEARPFSAAPIELSAHWATETQPADGDAGKRGASLRPCAGQRRDRLAAQDDKS